MQVVHFANENAELEGSGNVLVIINGSTGQNGRNEDLRKYGIVKMCDFFFYHFQSFLK